MSIEAVMMVALGFFAAMLLALAIAPAYRKRTERLTAQAIRNAMPLTEDEIRADKDRLRAGYAIRIHDLEGKVERTTLETARQRVEINRRDATISGLEEKLGELTTALEEQANARRVLERTIMDRLPKVEERLAEAKDLLAQRDDEIARLSESAQTRGEALEEARQIELQNRDEIHRLQAALNARAARKRDGSADARYEAEIALRSELEAMRSKTREQSLLIDKLQKAASGGAAKEASAGPAKEAARLRGELAKAEAELRKLKSSANAAADTREELDSELRKLKATVEDQKLEIARLDASLKAYKDPERKDPTAAESRMALKARIAALESQCDGQAATIQSLRAELEAQTERLSRQASQYAEELRRLGAGRLSPVAEGGEQAAVPQAGSAAALSRASLSERIGLPRAVLAEDGGGARPTGQGGGAKDSVRRLETAHPADGGETQQVAEGSGAKARRSGGLLERITRLDSAE